MSFDSIGFIYFNIQVVWAYLSADRNALSSERQEI